MKTNMKKFISLALALVMLLSLMTACGPRSNSSKEETKADPQSDITIPDIPSDDDDKPVPQENTKVMTSEEVNAYLKPRVVRVETDQGHGSGFFIDDQGTIVTNYHVIDNANSINVVLNDGGTYKVETLVDYSPYHDIAVLKINKTNTPYLTFATEYREGSDVYILGSPKDAESSFSSGTLSVAQVKLGLVDCIQTTAAINPGNSGGPAVNNKGELLGIVSYKRNDAENMGYAIKASVMDVLTLDKNYSMNRYLEWRNTENARSYMTTADNRSFYYTYVHTYTTVTGAECLASTDDGETGENGYAIMYLYYLYNYKVAEYDQYCDYLRSLGFEYNDANSKREMGWERVVYTNAFEGYSIIMEIDTVDNILQVSCPLM